MKSIVLLVLAGVLLVGCAPKEPVAEPNPTGTTALPPGGAAGGSTGDIAPMTPTPIPNAPVSGGSSLGDGGGSVGIAAKSKAKEVAGNASQGSLGNPDNQDFDDEDGN